MARRIGKFNPRQPRDSHGRWKRGGGSSSSAKAVARKPAAKKAVSNKPTASSSKAVAKPKSAAVLKRERNQKITSVAVTGFLTAIHGRAAVLHARKAASHLVAGQNIQATANIVAAGTRTYRVASGVASNLVYNSKKLTPEQKKTFQRRVKKIDKQIGRIETTANLFIAGTYLAPTAGPLLAQGIRTYKANRAAKNASAANSLIVGLKTSKLRSGGFYNISDFKGRRV